MDIAAHTSAPGMEISADASSAIKTLYGLTGPVHCVPMRLRYRLWPVIVFAFTACQPSPPPAGIFRDYVQQNPRALDPALATDLTAGKILARTHRGLFRYDTAGQTANDLATAWRAHTAGDIPPPIEIATPIGRAALVVDISLDSRVRFSDGVPLASYDAAFSLLRITNRTLAAEALMAWLSRADFADWLSDPRLLRQLLERPALIQEYFRLLPVSPFEFQLANLRLAWPIERDRLRIYFAQAAGLWRAPLTLTGAYIQSLRAHLRNLAEEKGPLPGEAVAGLGPFRLAEYLPNHWLRLTARAGAFPAPALRGYEYHIVQQEASARFLFLKGGLDLLNPPPFLARDLIASPGYFRKDNLAAHYFAINTRDPTLDRAFRRALNKAIPIPLLIEKLTHDMGRRAYGPAPSSLLPASIIQAAERDDLFVYDPAAARSSLEASAYDGRELRLLVKQDSEVLLIAQAVAAYAARVGIRIAVVPTDKRALLQANAAGEGELFYFTWFADHPDYENFLTPLFHSRNAGLGGNRSHFSNPETDSHLEELAIMPAGAARDRLAGIIISKIIDDAPWLFLWNLRENFVTGPRVAEFPVYPIYSGDHGEDIRLK